MNDNQLSFNCISKHRGVLMGLTIISILIFHFTEDCVNNDYNLFSWVVNYKTYVGSCGVDIFLFLSGFGLYYSYKKNPDRKNFYQKRLIRILIPYALVALPSWIILDTILTNAGLKQALRDFLFLSFFTDGTKWFWYILLILICYFLYPYMFEYIDNEENDKIKMLHIFVFISMLDVLLQLYNPTLFSRIEIALTRFPAFFAGCLIGKASYQNKKIGSGTILVCILPFLLLFFKETSKSVLSRYLLGAAGIVTALFIAMTLELPAAKKLRCTLLKNVVEWFGNYSLELYLIHVAVRKIMNLKDLPTHRIRYYILMLVISIILSLIVKKLSNLLANLYYKRK